MTYFVLLMGYFQDGVSRRNDHLNVEWCVLFRIREYVRVVWHTDYIGVG